MTTALDIAKYIVQEALRRKAPVSNLKLQKLLYFVQGTYLAMYKEVAFQDKIIAWQYGPVVRDVYYAYSMFGANDIIPIDNDEIIELSPKLKEVIDLVLDKLLNASAIALVNETHKKNSPWDQVDLNETISIDSIAEYFLDNYTQVKNDE